MTPLRGSTSACESRHWPPPDAAAARLPDPVLPLRRPRGSADIRLGNWNDTARGTVPIGWAPDPNLIARFPPMFDLMLRTLTPNDRLTTGDSGAGYLNPTQLFEPRAHSNLPSAAATWVAHSVPLYQRFDMTFTGMYAHGRRVWGCCTLALGAAVRSSGACVALGCAGFVINGAAGHMTTEAQDMYTCTPPLIPQCCTVAALTWLTGLLLPRDAQRFLGMA